MLPNRATTVETSRTSHVVMSPIPSHHHHHHPPPPPLRAAATAAIGPPGEHPLLGQSGVSSLTPPAPNDVAHEPATSHPITPPNNTHEHATSAPNDNAQQTPRTCHVTGQRHRPTTPTKLPRHRLTTPNTAAMSPPANDDDTAHVECHHHHITTKRKRQEVGMVGKDGRRERIWGEGGWDDDDDLVVVVPRIFCQHQGGWRAGGNDIPRHCPPELTKG